MGTVGGGKDARGRGRRRRKVSYLTINKIYTIDYKDISLLRRFVIDQGKIVPSRQSGATAKEQRMISTAVRRAREMALIPFVMSDTRANERRPHSDRRPPRGGRDYRGDDSPQQSREYRGEDSPTRETPAQAPPPEAAQAQATPRVEQWKPEPKTAWDERAAKSAVDEYTKSIKAAASMADRARALEALVAGSNKLLVKPLAQVVETEKSVVLKRRAAELLASQPADAAAPALVRLVKSSKVGLSMNYSSHLASVRCSSPIGKCTKTTAARCGRY